MYRILAHRLLLALLALLARSAASKDVEFAGAAPRGWWSAGAKRVRHADDITQDIKDHVSTLACEVQVDVVPVRRIGLTRAHPGHGQHPDEGLVGRRPGVLAGQQVLRDHLVTLVEGVRVAGEDRAHVVRTIWPIPCLVMARRGATVVTNTARAPGTSGRACR